MEKRTPTHFQETPAKAFRAWKNIGMSSGLAYRMVASHHNVPKWVVVQAVMDCNKRKGIERAVTR